MSTAEITSLLDQIDSLQKENALLETELNNKVKLTGTYVKPEVKKTVCLIDTLQEGIPGPEHFRIEETAVPVLEEDGGVLLQVLAMSADPYLRGGIKPGRGKKAGDAMSGFVSGIVLESKNPKWVEGDLFGAALEFSNIILVTKEMMAKTLMWKLTGLVEEKNISYGVGVMGMPGSTAYGGLIDVLRPNKGETIFISAAAGAVGGLVGQIAKNEFGCKVVGSCGGPEKGKIILDQYGFDAHVDYKQASNIQDLKGMLKEAAPDGIDMYFENVGGMHFETAMSALRSQGRIAVCGCIANYNKNTSAEAGSLDESVLNKINIADMIYSAQRIEGFVCMPWLSGAKGNFLKDMSRWLKEGKISVQETFHEGIEQWPVAFQSLFTGANKGKVVIRL
jgi:NADPH-dependent curcumin reductase CurA